MANAKRIEDFIQEQNAELQKKQVKFEKRKKRFKKTTLICSCVFIAIIIISLIIDFSTRDQQYKKYKNMDLTQQDNIVKLAASSDILTHPDMYEKYESSFLGNKSFHSINYGLCAENSLGNATISENGETILTLNGKTSIISTTPISYINILENAVIFRDYPDKKIYSVNHDGTNRMKLIDDKAGETVVTGNENVYYINYSKNNALYRYDIKSKKSNLVFEADIKTFSIIGDKILYLDYNNRLNCVSMNGTVVWTQDKVDKYYFDGRVYIQNNNSVISFNLYKHKPQNVVSEVDELLGVDSGNLYYISKNKLYEYNINNNEKTELKYKYDYYKGVYKIDGKIIAIGGVQDEN